MLWMMLIISFLTSWWLINYLISVIKWEIQVNKVTWFIRAFAPFISILAAFISKWFDIILLSIAANVCISFLIFIASFFNKKNYWKLNKLDYACLILSLLAILLRWISNNPNTAVTFSILADFIAAIPLIIKIYKNPETEKIKPFTILIIANTATLLLAEDLNFIKHWFLIYLIILEAILIIDFYAKTIVYKIKKMTERVNNTKILKLLKNKFIKLK